MKKLISLLVVLSCLIYGLPLFAAPSAGHKGMVSSAHPMATEAGVEILRQGGNAADAAAAVAFVLAVVEPYSSGIGGGGFALLKHNEAIRFLDFREIAPKRSTRDMYIRNGKADTSISRDGVLSVAVPGAVAGYLELQEKYGVLTRQDVLRKAIEFAENGFAVTTRYQTYATKRLEQLRKDAEISRIFLVKSKDGNYETPPIGHIVKQPELAQTLTTISEQGASAFYQGSIAQALVQDMEERQGIISKSDLSDYKIRYRKPLVGSYRGHAVVSSPPPSSGGQIILSLLNVMEQAPTNEGYRSVENLHLYIEASKRVFADRALLGDPDYLSYLPGLIPHLIAKDRGPLLAQAITPQATPARDIAPAQGSALPADVPRTTGASHSAGMDTTHLSVVDKDGNAVAMTTTVNYSWGACIAAKGTGIIWNDEMDDFAAAPGVPNVYGIVGSHANAVEPGKVPLSSMSPTFVFQTDSLQSPLQMVVGSPGGSRIPTTVAQAIMHVIDHGANAQEAISIGRIHHQHLPDLVFVEDFALEAATIEALKAKGHTLKLGGRWSNATIITIDPKTNIRYGAADHRGVGTALAE